MNSYQCFYERRVVEIEAKSTWEAQQKAQQRFKISDKKRHLISVMLVAKDGQPVTHLALM
jgi:hypothetical protein